MTTAEQIRAIRARTGLSQEAFARVYEIPKRTVENWEAGTRCPPPYFVKLLDLAVQALPPEKLKDPR